MYLVKHYYSPKQDVAEGLITPIDWDNNGTPCQFSLYTATEEDIIIDAPQMKRRLNNLINKPVIIRGHLYQNNWGEKVIRAKKIRPLKHPAYHRSTPKISSIEEFPLPSSDLIQQVLAS